jgi:hypothetical protein
MSLNVKIFCLKKIKKEFLLTLSDKKDTETRRKHQKKTLPSRV